MKPKEILLEALTISIYIIIAALIYYSSVFIEMIDSETAYQARFDALCWMNVIILAILLKRNRG